MNTTPAIKTGRRMTAALLTCALAGVAVAAQSATAAPVPMPRASATLAKTGTHPNAVAADAMGNVYTANSGSDNVTKVNALGKASIMGTTGDKPSGIAVDPSGNVYTSNLGSKTVTKIAPDGTSTTLGTTGDTPLAVTLDSAGNVYTSNYADNTVTKITQAGVSTTWATGKHPLGIKVDSAGNVYTANEADNTVTKIAPDGTASTLGTTGGWPQALALDSSGNVYTANWNSRNVSKITPSGTSTIYGRTGRRPVGLTIDPYGNVYTANDGASSVSKITPGGMDKVVAQTGRRPMNLTSDAAGNIYVANFLSSSITQVFPAPAKSPSVISLSTVTVSSPNNPAAWIIPFYNDVWQDQSTCEAAFPAIRAQIDQSADPAAQTAFANGCMGIGSVSYNYDIAETELTVAQWVNFLNTVDPYGKNAHHLWDAAEASSQWPKYGSVNVNRKAPRGQHYYVSAPVWANKPYNQADFMRTARLANSLQNGKLLSKRVSYVTTVSGTRLKRTTYKVRMSPLTETGQYTLTKLAATRNLTSGFAVSSQDEWVKAAYFDPNGGGKFSYWDYPTNPGLYVNCPVDKEGCATGQQPNQSQLDGNGNVMNPTAQPLASYEATPGNAPDWCPSQFTAAQCTITPFTPAESLYVGNVSTVGQTLTRSPWGTLDQGGNVVETTDTIAPPPQSGGDPKIVWRRWHGGVTAATAYQLWLSAVGDTPQTVPGFSIQPWRGIRLTVRGK